MSLALYGHPFSSYTQKALIALYENGTPFEFRAIGQDTPEHVGEWLKRLTASGLLPRRADPHHRQKGTYSLTEAAIQPVPLLAHMGGWGRRHTRPSRELSVRAELLEQGGPPLWNAFMDELRHLHLGAPQPARSVFGELQAAYQKAVARRSR